MYINIHTHQASNNTGVTEIIDVSDRLSDTFVLPRYCSVGVHPWSTDSSYKEMLYKTNNVVRTGNIIAIGECGLDKTKGAHFDTQISVFKKHIQLSEELQKPLIIHCVKAYSEIIKLRKDLQPKQNWIFHGFNASPETMQQAVKQGFYISFGSALFNKYSKASQSIKQVPHNKLFLETDDQNDFTVEEIYYKAATLLNIDKTILQSSILTNFKCLFNVNIQLA